MVNFVGFEHVPADEEERRLLDSARVQLERPDELLRFDADAACSLRTASVTAPEAGHGNEDTTAAPSSRESGPGEHDHDRPDAGRSRETHREISGIYEFACSRPEHLSRIQVRIFDAFPDTEEIEVNLLGRSSGSHVILRPDSAELKLRD